MDILMTNIYYLLLVAGVLLAIMSIFTPGTGFFEVGAVFALLLAGFGILSEPINLWALFILVLGIFPFVLAVLKSKRIFWLAIASVAFVIGSAYMFRGGKWWQPAVSPVLAVVVSVLSSGFLWFATRKVLDARSVRPAHSLEALVGAVGETRTEVFNEGSVQVQGELWSARSETPIPVGTPVRVLRREGFTLEVEPAPSLIED